jgi:hypothetical protein
MSNKRMIFYKDWSGVEFEWRWMNEDHYRAAKAFLDQLTGGSARDDDPPLYWLNNKQQYNALLAFRRELERQWRLGR